MTEELQLVSENYDRELIQNKRKYDTDIGDLKNRLTEGKHTIEKLETENERLKKMLDISVNKSANTIPTIKVCDQNETIVPKYRIEYLEGIEIQYTILENEMTKLKCEKTDQQSKIQKIQVL